MPFLTRSFRSFFLFAVALSSLAALPSLPSSAQTGNRALLPPYWHPDDAAARTAAVRSRTADRLTAYRALTLDVADLRAATTGAPTEETVARRSAVLNGAPVLTLPTPDGGTVRFRLYETHPMAPTLAAQVPRIRTFAGVGADDAALSVRCDVSPLGFRALVLTPTGAFQIDPVSLRDSVHYLCYAHQAIRPDPVANGCATADAPVTTAVPPANTAHRTNALGTNGFYQNTFRVAFASTGQFTARCGGWLPTLGYMASLVNQVNAIYQRDASTRFQLVANELSIIYRDSVTDGYYDDLDTLMQDNLIHQNQVNLDLTLGGAQYDVGQVFNHGGGGLAVRSGAMFPFYKASATSGHGNPLDPYFLKTVIHEMGHQYGSPHTFNGSVNACGRQRTATTAWEPGAGISVMSYSGHCGSDNLQSAYAELFFHGGSLEIIGNNVLLLTTGANGSNSPASGNTPPVLSAQPANRTIPVNTPFRLTATATDADGDFLSYAWDEFDLGPAGPYVKPTDPQTAGDTGPLFRSWAPTAEPTRYFPRIGDAVPGEALPTVARDLHFRCTVRDGRGGLAQTADVTLTTAPGAGPFRITNPLTNNGFWWTSGQPASVIWDVANTNLAPISCATVNVRLTTDDGRSFTTLAANVPNNGVCAVQVPAGLTASAARVVVEAVGHVFYAVSSPFRIELPAPTLVGIEPAAAMPGETVVLTLDQPTVGNPAHFVFNVKLGTENVAFVKLSATQLQLTMPLTVVSSSNLVLTMNNTRNTATTHFRVLPLVRSLTPAAGAPGDSVAISIYRYSRFETPARQVVDVRFNDGTNPYPAPGTAAGFRALSDSVVRVAVPPGVIEGVIKLRYDYQGANSGSTKTRPFKVYSPIRSYTGGGPVGSSVVVELDSWAGNSTPITAATAVSLNGVAQTLTRPTPTLLRFTLPATATSGRIRVTYGTLGYVETALDFLVTPAITSVVPARGIVGNSITLTGTNFKSIAAVRFNGMDAAFTVVSATRITAVVPPGATTGRVTVLAQNAQTAQLGISAADFTIVDAPTLDSFAALATGQTTTWAGQTVQIIGTGLTGSTAVRFNGRAATSFSVVSDTEIRAVVAPGTTTGPVSVTTLYNTLTSVLDLTIVGTPALPVISSFTPTSGPIGTLVTVTGANFQLPNAVVGQATIGNGGLVFGAGGGASAVISNTEIRLQVGANTTSGLLTLTSPAGTGASVGAFTVLATPPPTISSFTPGTAAEGQYVTLTGTNFVDVTSVTLNGLVCPRHPFLNSGSTTAYTVRVPVGAVTGPLILTTPKGTATTASYLIVAPAPTISSFQPSSGPIGTTVTVLGTGLAQAADVFVGTSANGNAISPSATGTSATFVLMPDATTGRILVSTPLGFATSALDFEVTAGGAASAPILTAIAPANGQHIGGTITLTGTNLLGVADVRINGVSAQNVVAQSATEITATVPPGASTGRVSVTGPGGTAFSGADYPIIGAPTVAAFLPTVGRISTVVSLSGTNLHGATSVAFGGIAAPVISVNAAGTSLTAAVPNGAAPGPLTVTIPSLGTFTTAASFTVLTAATWTGAISTDWTNAANWAGNQLPGATEAAEIPAGKPRYPVLTAAQNIGVGSLTLAAGAVLTVSGTLTLTGDFTVFGDFRHVGGVVELAGTAPQQLWGNVTQTYRELTVGPHGATLNAPAKITRMLTLEGDFQTFQNLTLASSATSTAMLVNAGGVVVGPIFVQRYWAPGAAPGLGFRHLSAPVQGAPVSQLTVFGANGFTPLVNPAYNALPFVAPPTAKYPNLFGFDETRGGPTADFSTGYFSPNQPTDLLTSGRGYSAYMRPLTVTFFGEAQQGDVTVGPLSRTGSNGKSGWHLLGNPYASPLDWDAVAVPPGLSAAISVWQSTGGSNGIYRTRVSNSDGTGTGNLPDGLVPMGQGFFANIVDPTPLPLHLTFTNAHRPTTFVNPTAARAASAAVPTVQLRLQAPADSAATSDDTFIAFRPNATPALDAAFDGPRPALNIGHPTLVSGLPTGDLLAVNALPVDFLLTGTTVELTASVPTPGVWTLALAAADHLDGTPLTLLDRLTGTRYDLRQLTAYAFPVVQAGALVGRFALEVGAARPLGTAVLVSAPISILQAAPNPVRETLRLSGAVGRIGLYDALGRLVGRAEADSAGGATLPVRGLPAGVYVVRSGSQSCRVVVAE